MDEQLTISHTDREKVWTREGFLEAVRMLLNESNTLFDDMRKKLEDYPELKKVLYEILFTGKQYSFNVDDFAIDVAKMFDFIENDRGNVALANRIFETRLYNLFLSEEKTTCAIIDEGVRERNQFIHNDELDMERILQRFVVHFTELYGDSDEPFLEKMGRKYFLFYLKPIINGTGNYYIEAQTRDSKRTDVIVDYLGKQYIIEMKIWHGNEYNARGERQLLEYLDGYHLQRGYMLSFNFNKKKDVGVKTIKIKDKVLVEAVV